MLEYRDKRRTTMAGALSSLFVFSSLLFVVAPVLGYVFGGRNAKYPSMLTKALSLAALACFLTILVPGFWGLLWPYMAANSGFALVTNIYLLFNIVCSAYVLHHQGLSAFVESVLGFLQVALSMAACGIAGFGALLIMIPYQMLLNANQDFASNLTATFSLSNLLRATLAVAFFSWFLGAPVFAPYLPFVASMYGQLACSIGALFTLRIFTPENWSLAWPAAVCTVLCAPGLSSVAASLFYMVVDATVYKPDTNQVGTRLMLSYFK
jgi:hypothetical protein